MTKLNNMFDQFNSMYRIEPTKLSSDYAKSSLKLIEDELIEAKAEIKPEGVDMPNYVKENIDILYVCMQRLRAANVDIDGALHAVHSSNMSKAVSLKNAKEELEIARERYPNAILRAYADFAVLIDESTNKVIKPTTYTAAEISKDLYE